MNGQATFLLKTIVPAAVFSFCEVLAIGILLSLLPRMRFLKGFEPGTILARETAVVLVVLGLPIGCVVANVTGNYTALISVVFAIVIVIM